MESEWLDCRWEFLAFESDKEGTPVQDWYDGLPEDHRDLVKDRLSILQVTPRVGWDDPEFDELAGARGISEVRWEPIKCVRGKFYYRLYGFFGPEEQEYYGFLHGTNKSRRNDKDGKKIAEGRLREVESDEATLHPFDLD